ncbi:DUF4401 domain-containing protein [Herpetosiphon geysericola]|uniref:DUF4401 domain-containing protein n=1 Tax=Herpetosiphon geysericola TaxID=70996 RepID=A0A0P6Y3J8_9CHLR|nr:DUF4401 domain-containing protein [Herpetosiphon geysericola]KPL79517.1 hypothetical protein SE18_26620 [Herpetosiphon geysericola]
MNTARYSIRQLFADLELEPPGFVPAAQPPSEYPWYMRIFAGIGAWLAALLFIGFLVITRIIINEVGALIVGLILCGVSAGLHHNKSSSTFVHQFALATSIAGQILAVIGWVVILDGSYIGSALGVIVLEIVLFAIQRDFIQRLIATLAIIAAIHVIVGDLSRWNENFNYIYLLLSCLIIMFSGFLWLEPKIHADELWPSAAPIGYGILLFMGASSIFTNVDWADLALRSNFFMLPALVGIICLGISIWMIINEFAYQLNPIELGSIGIGLLFIAFIGFNTPAIIIALLILVLSYWRGYWVMFGFGCLALLSALSLYYYNLNISLLYKSIILFASGLTLLVIRALIIKLNQKEAL